MEHNSVRSVIRWYKKKKWRLIGLVVLAAVVALFLLRGGERPTYEKITAQKSDLIQEVSVTGKIKPAQAVDLQFENSGRIAAINYKVGDKVNFGVVIASLENQDLQAQVIEKEAALESVKADLAKSKKNLASLSDPAISTVLRTDFENAKTNLDNIKIKANDDLSVDYNAAFNAINEAMTQANSSFIVFKNIRETYFDTGSDESRKVYTAEKSAQDLLFGFYLPPSDNVIGADDYVLAVNSLRTDENIDQALVKLESAIITLQHSYSTLQSAVQSNLNIVSAANRDKVNTEANNVSSELSAVTVAAKAINSQKITDAKAISDAEQSLAKARVAFPTPEDIDQKEAAVKQAEAALLFSRSQLRKSLIVAPFAGIIGKIDVERGQTVSSSIFIVSLVSVASYQINANITEVDIGKVSLGNPAALTFDAYGSQIVFNARVSAIDTSATIVEGVTTYKTVFDFDGPVDQDIRPNMTANIDIETARKENVISIPQRAVISKNGDKFVRIYRGDKVAPEERTVQTGMSGKDGYVEIASGLSEGDEVITFIND